MDSMTSGRMHRSSTGSNPEPAAGRLVFQSVVVVRSFTVTTDYRLRTNVIMNLLHLLQQQFHAALAELIADPAPYAAQVKPVQDPKHGDYQANCAMQLAKTLGRKPRDLAQEIVQRLDLGGCLEKPEIAGPEFWL